MSETRRQTRAVAKKTTPPQKKRGVKKDASPKRAVRKSVAQPSKVPRATSSSVTIAAKRVTLKTAAEPKKESNLRSHVLTRVQLVPIDLHSAVVQTARVAGVVCAFVGGFFILQLAPAAFTTTASTAGQAPTHTAAVAQATPLLSPTSTTAPTASAYLELSGSNPLSGQVTLRAIAPNAKKVDFYVFSGSWNNKAVLGSGTQVRSDIWEFTWDSATVPDNTDYRFIAYVWDESAVTDRYDYDLQLVNYYTVLNAPVVTAPAIQNVSPEPSIALTATQNTDKNVTLTTTVANADTVQLRAENTDTGVRYALTDPVKNSAGDWVLNWDTRSYVSGTYKVWAKVAIDTMTYTSSDTVVKLTTATTPVEPQTTVATSLPTLELGPLANTKLSGNVSLHATVRAATNVNFYIQDTSAAAPKYLGSGVLSPNSTAWYFNWYTIDVPNGDYHLFARAVTPYGVVESDSVLITISNSFPPQTSAKVTSLAKDLADVDTLLAEVDTTANQQPELSIASTTPDADFAFFTRFEELFQDELHRLSTAIQNQDSVAEGRVRSRLTELRDRAWLASPLPEDNVLQDTFNQWFQDRIVAYLTEVEHIEQLITERQLVNVLQDSDRDGISDFDETTIYHTDPFVADTDGDGIVDGVEVLGGFDPLDPTREVPLEFQSAKESGQVRSDILSVDEVLPIVSEDTATSSQIAVAVFTGKGLPNSFVTLYIYSTPLVVTVKTDEDGTWRYRFDQELEDGSHEIYVGITDNAGRIIAKSEAFGFIKEAQAISPSVAAALDTAPPPPERSLVASSLIYMVLAVSVLAIGLVLLLLGLHLDAQRRKEREVTPTTTAV